MRDNIITKVIFRVIGLPFIGCLVLIVMVRDYTYFLVRWLTHGGSAFAWTKEHNADDIRELVIELKKQREEKEMSGRVTEIMVKENQAQKFKP
jgi:hypothetical protein